MPNYTPDTWDGNDINDGSTFSAKFRLMGGNIFSINSPNPSFANRINNYPILTSVEGQVRYLEITITLLDDTTYDDDRDTLAGYFDMTDLLPELKTLVVKDDSAVSWEVDGMAIGFVWDLPNVIVTIAIPDPRWKKSSQTTTNWSITASGQTKSVTPAGNIRSRPVFEITPTSARSGNSQLYRRFVEVINQVNRAIPGNYAWNLANSETGNGLDTATLVGGGKMRSDGADIRVYVDGFREDRWLQDMNTSSTEIWIRLRLSKPLSFTLNTAIAGTGAVSEIDIVINGNSLRNFSSMPEIGQVKIGSEYFVYSGITSNNSYMQLTGVARAAFGSSMAAHSVGDTITWIEHQIFLEYGDSGETDDGNSNRADRIKPIFQLTSENDRLDYTLFNTERAAGSNEWTHQIGSPFVTRSVTKDPTFSVVTKWVGTYTDSHDGTTNYPNYADPSTLMGHYALSIPGPLSGTYIPTEGYSIWKFFHTCGIDGITITGQKYALDVTYWGLVQLMGSDDGVKWQLISAEDAPSVDDTWENIDLNASLQSLSTPYRYIMIMMKSVLPEGTTEYLNALEHTAVQIDLVTANVPSFSIGAELSTQYELKRVTLANTTTGQAIYIKKLLMEQTNDTLVIDCENKMVYVQSNEKSVRSFVDFDTIRQDWMYLEGGISNVLQWTDSGTGNVTVDVKHYDRNN